MSTEEQDWENEIFQTTLALTKKFSPGEKIDRVELRRQAKAAAARVMKIIPEDL